MIKNYNFKLINNLIYYRIIYSVLLSFFLVIISLNNAKANETVDPYVVKNIVVDITSTTTSNARDIALNKAQRIAYLKLIKRLVVADQINLVPKINDKKIIEMISSLQIDKEKALDKRYFATFLVKFNSSKIREFLKSNDILFSESISKRQIIIPVYEKEGVMMLWDDPNKWRISWINLTQNQNKIFPIFVPEGSLSDIATINAKQAINSNQKSLDKILSRYELENGIIAHAVLVQDLNANLLRLHVTLTKFGEQLKSVNIQSFSIPNGNSEQALLDMSVKNVFNNILEEWKLENIIRFDNPNTISVSILTPDIKYFNEVIYLIKKTRVVEKVDVVNINKNVTQILVHFYGNSDQLVSSLQRNNLKLINKNNYWNIKIIDN
ncbi:MAG: hypothetical protein CMM49_00605 [Rhodospirillaceae bacterium]|nr:hypothetical protein [Rhodospirillaceae bacterium]|tara:strand:- start:811 stop:1953 length:1143 start_codon:yes stop_codon:yes gene_type:complete